ncbi:hypothetical protein HMPREF3291_06525 [Bacillus sp. HMSC76G11]|nr:hypothetical protein HMPREF3291_06525 [Bacillus sp. HMSC76G11]
MIISGGVNIYPNDIEDVIYTHPEVLEATVIGAPNDKQKKWGESVKAYVVLKKDSVLEKELLIEYCNRKLAKYQFIKEIEYISSLPRNSSGKILKINLRDINKAKVEVEETQWEN